ncbi:MAG TPA: acyltransferase [Ktedonobacteraceae bacterium]|nr:acyltransferase [Ktedonobacteraceae bacterium]
MTQLAQSQGKRPHIYELDPIRICTAVGVVGVHALFFTLVLNQTGVGLQIQNAIITALHFTREIFMFVTAFALVYVYYGKPFPLMQFWKKRSIGVLLPYAVWSVIYVWVNMPHKTPGTFISTSLLDILTGNASYQLYYILLTLQFYLIFPLFLLFLYRFASHPWRVLVVSLVLQLLLYYVDFHTLQQGTLASSPFWQWVSDFQNRFVLVYQFFFVLGGFTALYFQQVRAFVLRHGKLIVGGFLLVLVGLWVHFALQVNVYHESIGLATSVLQPAMLPYSIGVIFFALWLAGRWATHEKQGKPRNYHIWQTLSDSSFGVYLIHALILNALIQYVMPAMPTVWPVVLRVLLIWFTTAGGATLVSIILLNIPIASRLVGRETTRQRNQKKLQSLEPAPVQPTNKTEVAMSVPAGREV